MNFQKEEMRQIENFWTLVQTFNVVGTESSIKPQ